MKTALLPKPETAPSNIIYLTDELFRENRGPRKSIARIQTPTHTLSRGPQLKRQSQNSVRSLLAETGDILARHPGVASPMARGNRCHSNGLPDSILFVLPDVLRNEDSPEAGAPASPKRPMKNSNTRARMEELFALKRQELPPENFISDFILEFQRRNYKPAASSRSSASKRNNSHRA